MLLANRRCYWIIGLLALVLVTTGCNFSKGGTDIIDLDGSSTVFPIAEAMVEEFGKQSDGGARVVVGISGTGGGFKKFCNGETDVNNASRPIKAREVALCAEEGIEFVEVPIALDGLTVAVHQENHFAQCITVDELHTMWSPEAEDEVTRWNQVRPTWPDERMQLYGPGVDSGTFDYFTDVINGEAQASRGDFISNERDDVLIQGIAGGKFSLGYFGYSFFAENEDILNSVAVDSGNGCVSPTDQTINDGSYSPLSRPLFIYIRKSAEMPPIFDQFVEFVVNADRANLIQEVGYVPLADEIYELALARFGKGLTGTLFGGENPAEGSVLEVLAANQ